MHSSPDTDPARGTAQRPILTPAELVRYSEAHYLAAGDTPWAPEALPWQAAPDFIVGAGGSHATLQAAVDAACRLGGRTRRVIHVRPGRYPGVTYVPHDAPPLTVLGTGTRAEEVSLEFTLDARMSTAEYRARVEPCLAADSAGRAMFEACAARAADGHIDTGATAVLWVQADDFQLARVAVTNTLLDSVDGGSHQAVALRSDGDRAHFEQLRLIGRQDTLLVNAGELPTPDNHCGMYTTTRRTRAVLRHCFIEGDTDFVFGRASAVFTDCDFHCVGTRHQRPAVVFAPSTLPDNPWGFLVLRSRFTGDALHRAQGGCQLGRSWDQGTRERGYQPGLSPNGQLLISECYLDEAFHPAAPWGPAATSARPHCGNAGSERDLDDPAFNRLWEYANFGAGAPRR